jgi:hypothetical protein
MNRTIVCLASFLALICCALPIQAQQAAATTSAVSNPDAPVSCTHLFTVNPSSSNAFMQYCVTDNGNISSIETPFGHFHLSGQGEGYGICQESPATEYHDYAIGGATSNWGAAHIVSVSKSVIKISRSTGDGNWTLMQTISKVAATGSIKIVMALTNNQTVDKVAYLVRFADVDPDERQISNALGGGSLQSAFALHNTPGDPFHYGLQLQNAGQRSGYQEGFVQRVATGPNACAFAFNADVSGIAGNIDISLVYAYVGPVPAHQTVTVTLNYRGL